MHLEVLIGPIASGKSTWTKERALEGALVSNDDSWVTAVHGGNYKLYNKKLKALYKSYEATTLNMGAVLGLDVIIDRTNLTRRMRSRYISLARSIDMPVIGIVFPIITAEVHAQRRASSDGRGHDYTYWLKVCKEHLEQYEPPDTNEGFDKLLTFTQASDLRRVEGKTKDILAAADATSYG